VGIFIEYPLRLETDGYSFVRPSIHRDMLTDATRMDAFKRAIDKAIKPGMVVADIGTGTGILAYWAAKAGAEHVYAIEASAMAGKAEEILAQSGVADRVTVLRGLSYEVDVPKPCDVIVSETLGHVGIDEGCLPVAKDAQRFLKPDGIFIPGDVELIAQVVNCPAFAHEISCWRPSEDGFDASPMRQLALEMSYLTSSGSYEALSELASVVRYRLGDDLPGPWGGKMVSKGRIGKANAIVVSFRSELVPGVSIEGSKSSNWRVALLPFSQPLKIGKDDEVEVEVELFGDPVNGELARWRAQIVGSDQSASGRSVPLGDAGFD